jgi:MFS family permease
MPEVTRPSLSPFDRSRARNISVLDGVLHAVMLGASESYLGTLAVELGHGPRAMSLLSSVPLLVGAIAQLSSGLLVTWLGSRKRLVVLGAALQAFSHVGLIWVAYAGRTDLAALLVFKTLFWMSGAVIAPAWGAWMSLLTDDGHRERYFARRSAVVYAGLLVSFVASGVGLNSVPASGRLDVFSIMFGVAALARAGSAYALWRQPDSPRRGRPDPSPLTKRFVDALSDGEWRTPIYLAGLMFGVYLSVPFFTPYMLRELHFDYASFVQLTGLSILSKALTFPLCHPLALRFGLRAILLVSGLGIAALPALWALLTDVHALMLVEVFGGAVWAGLEYTSFQLILRSAKDTYRVELLAISGSITGVAQLAGSYGGAMLIEQPSLGYHGVFWASAVLRALSLGIFVLILPRLRLRGALVLLFTRLMSIRPNAGATQRPVVEDDAA